ncbi:MAG: GNAT family N-acetyltransferase [Cyanobacteria bacterium P01_E01_bin.6]
MFSIHSATAQDEPFLWDMLAVAAHMDEAGERPDSAKTNPFLSRYVSHWGKSGDVGCIACLLEYPHRQIAAAWCRLLPPMDNQLGYVSADIPELAIATIPEFQGQGAGSAVLHALIDAARDRYSGLSLNVRIGNPALRLYERFGFRIIPDSNVINRVGGQSVTMALIFHDTN